MCIPDRGEVVLGKSDSGFRITGKIVKVTWAPECRFVAGACLNQRKRPPETGSRWARDQFERFPRADAVFAFADSYHSMRPIAVDVCGFASVVALNEPGEDFIGPCSVTILEKPR